MHYIAKEERVANSEQEFLKYIEQYAELFTPQELETIKSGDIKGASSILQEKQGILPSTTDFENFLPDKSACEFSAVMQEIYLTKLFLPSRSTRQYLLCANTIASAVFSKEHFTIRKDLDLYMLAHTFKGSGTLEYADNVYSLEPGDVFLIDCRRPHHYFCTSEDGWGYDIIHFNGLSMPHFFSAIENSGPLKFTFGKDTAFYGYLNQLKQQCQSEVCTDHTVHMLITCLLTEMLNARSGVDYAHMPSWLSHGITYINTHYQDDLTLEGLAETVGISKYHLAREFKKFTGKTFSHYLGETRLQEAKRYLVVSELSVSVIAERVGFHSQYYFINLFKQLEGITPLQYRKKFKELYDVQV